MRLLLLPISTRRTLIYCERLHITTTDKQTWLDKGTVKAANLWARWEKKESGWQKKVVDYGNQALKRIPYEEWGLKSIPPLSARIKAEEMNGEERVEVSFPKKLIPEDKVLSILRQLGTERQALHQKRMIYSFIGMPISAPFALVPIIPNLPFFYLVFRAWSHWRALSGSKHVEFLLDNKLIKTAPSKILDDLYANGKGPFGDLAANDSAEPRPGQNAVEEHIIIDKSDGKRIAAGLNIPALEIELGRAVWQVEQALKAEKEVKAEKERENETSELRKVNEERNDKK